MPIPDEQTPLVNNDDKHNYDSPVSIETGGTSSSFSDDDGVENGSIIHQHLHSHLRRFSAALNQHVGKIGMLGSVSIAANSLTGPAMLNLPATFQRSGLIPTTLAVIFVCILAALCSLHMANTISKVRGNKHFAKEVS